MHKVTYRIVGTIGTVVAAAVATAFLVWPSAPQTGTTVVKRSWTAQPRSLVTDTGEPPALTRDIENPDRLPPLPNNWYSELTGLGDGGAGCGSGFSINPGDQIIINLISVKIISPTALQGPYVSIYTSNTGSTDESKTSSIQIALQSQGLHYFDATHNYYHYVGLQPVHLRIQKDDWLCESAYVGSAFVQSGTAHISYFGYILPAP